MPDLRIDLSATPALIGHLDRWARTADDIADAVESACASAGLDSYAAVGLRRAGNDAAQLARMVRAAHQRASSFRLPPLHRVGPHRVRPSMSPVWNHVREPSSHNTYLLPGGIAEARERGFRSYELDLHIGRPTELTGVLDPLGWVGLAAIAVDGMTHGEPGTGDWYVYHHSLDTDSAHPTLSVALGEVAGLPATGGPTTLFLDLKDPLTGSHSAEALDRLLDTRLGDRLFTPADLLDRAPATDSLAEAALTAGWPTAAELDGRIIVVVTDHVDAYLGRPIGQQRAFVAPELTVTTYASHDIVFFNEASSRISRTEVEAIADRASLLRTWGPPDEDGLAANYVAID